MNAPDAVVSWLERLGLGAYAAALDAAGHSRDDLGYFTDLTDADALCVAEEELGMEADEAAAFVAGRAQAAALALAAASAAPPPAAEAPPADPTAAPTATLRRPLSLQAVLLCRATVFKRTLLQYAPDGVAALACVGKAWVPLLAQRGKRLGLTPRAAYASVLNREVALAASDPSGAAASIVRLMPRAAFHGVPPAVRDRAMYALGDARRRDDALREAAVAVRGGPDEYSRRCLAEARALGLDPARHRVVAELADMLGAADVLAAAAERGVADELERAVVASIVAELALAAAGRDDAAYAAEYRGAETWGMAAEDDRMAAYVRARDGPLPSSAWTEDTAGATAEHKESLRRQRRAGAVLERIEFYRTHQAPPRKALSRAGAWARPASQLTTAGWR